MTHLVNSFPGNETFEHEAPEDAHRQAAKIVFDLETRIHAGEFNDPNGTSFHHHLRNEFASVILAERKRCADIADRMRIRHGSPVMGPYENGQWDQGKRIAALIRGEPA